MKPLTEQNVWNSPLSKRDLFTREDVLSAVALLKKKMIRALKEPCDNCDICKTCQSGFIDLINKCFQIQNKEAGK